MTRRSPRSGRPTSGCAAPTSTPRSTPTWSPSPGPRAPRRRERRRRGRSPPGWRSIPVGACTGATRRPDRSSGSYGARPTRCPGTATNAPRSTCSPRNPRPRSATSRRRGRRPRRRSRRPRWPSTRTSTCSCSTGPRARCWCSTSVTAGCCGRSGSPSPWSTWPRRAGRSCWPPPTPIGRCTEWRPGASRARWPSRPRRSPAWRPGGCPRGWRRGPGARCGSWRARPTAAAGRSPFASDVELDGEDRLVVAGRPGEDLLRFEFEDGVVAEGKPLQAPRWTAGGLVRTPDGRIGFWTDHGFRVAVEARPRYEEHGSVDLFRLDAGVYRTQWGRIFVEACIPGGTSVRAAFVTSDDEPGETENDGPSIARTVPSNLTASIRLPRAWPPLVAASRVPELARLRPLHRRETGMDVAWARRDPDDRFEVYEAPVAAPPGRYLWVRLDLRGTRGASPRVRAARVEHPGHDWRSRLPRVYSDDPAAASFLDRYLAMPAGVLADVEERTMRD